MPAKHNIDTNARLLITTWEGEAIDTDLIDAIKKYQANIQSDSAYSGFNEIVDFTKVTNIKLTIQGIKNISSIAPRTDNVRIRSRLAFLVSSKLAFNLVSLYKTYRSFNKNSNKEIRVFFNDEKGALEWVEQ